MLPDLQHIIPLPALPRCCVPLIQSYLFIHLCPSRDHLFFHLLPALSEQTGRLLGRTQPGQRPAQRAQGWLDTPLPAWGQGSTPWMGGWDASSPHFSLAVLIFGPSWETLNTEDAPGPAGTATYLWLEEMRAENGFGTWLNQIQLGSWILKPQALPPPAKPCGFPRSPTAPPPHHLGDPARAARPLGSLKAQPWASTCPVLPSDSFPRDSPPPPA